MISVAATRESKGAAFERHFVVLCSLLILVSFVVSLSEVTQYLAGQNVYSGKVTSWLRWLREGIYLTLVLDFALCTVRAGANLFITRRMVEGVGLTCVLISLTVAYSVHLGLPVLVIAAGMRFFEYIPLALISASVLRACGMRPFRRIAYTALAFIVIESIIGALETRLPVSFYGTTFLGSRAFGTFESPNLYGPAIAFVYLLIRQTLPKGWIRLSFVLALADVLMSGSRAAILDLAIIEACFALGSIRSIWYRAISVMVAVCLSPLALIAVTAPEITGRATGIGAGGFERAGVWARVLSNVKDAPDLLLGWGMGLGSNTVFSIYDYTSTIRGEYIADNTLLFLLGSYGVFGVLLCVTVLGVLTWKLRNDPPGLALACAFVLQLMVVQVMEIYPVNALSMMMFGLRFGILGGRPAALRRAIPVVRAQLA
jgi:hypothetical protein